jgi:cation transport ATPase
MKQKSFLISLFLTLFYLNATNLFAFVVSNSTVTYTISPPQYFTRKIEKKAEKTTRFNETDDKVKLDKLARKSLILGILSPVGFAVFLHSFIRIGVATLLAPFVSIAFALLAFIIGNRVLKNATSTEKQKKRAKAGKIMGIFTISLILLSVLWGSLL